MTGTYPLRVRFSEVGADGGAGSAAFLGWLEEAAFLHSRALGYGPAEYARLGALWVVRATELEMAERPGHGDELEITTWVSESRGAQARREFELRRAAGPVVARAVSQFIFLAADSLRPRRIPAEIVAALGPGRARGLAGVDWPAVGGPEHVTVHEVAGHEEDGLRHVNNAAYLRWIEENARRAARTGGRAAPQFTRHRVEYLAPAFGDDTIRVASRAAPDGSVWAHELFRGAERIARAWSRAAAPW